MPADDSIIHELRQQITKLEERAEKLGKQFARYEIGMEKWSPMLTSVMREGVPLEIFARLAVSARSWRI